ncbi:hypothetical protein IMG5_198100 [Ichthyophthirius multifiliis]|uniref:Uncharacterized protein n=1 Tax=Ichthyophthirius multifiliis TaxID=5932 RepID=G0R5E4_ICHMU|nr:hypothetical protein IMG5_198100 [Ichthyophthirius multifiliis]EGR27302.1 hypothetical protein IMG5_198100 [Ichthyophthirius multifiliis]|eukprot:XP_004024186.1 hypothetical protein IMG5_198100 [Ichthyophthirius multifiliis]
MPPKTQPPQKTTQKPSLQPPAQKPAVQPPAQKPAIQPPAQKPAVQPPAQKPAVQPPAQKPAVQTPAQKPAAQTVVQKSNQPVPVQKGPQVAQKAVYNIQKQGINQKPGAQQVQKSGIIQNNQIQDEKKKKEEEERKQKEEFEIKQKELEEERIKKEEEQKRQELEKKQIEDQIIQKQEEEEKLKKKQKEEQENQEKEFLKAKEEEEKKQKEEFEKRKNGKINIKTNTGGPTSKVEFLIKDGKVNYALVDDELALEYAYEKGYQFYLTAEKDGKPDESIQFFSQGSGKGKVFENLQTGNIYWCVVLKNDEAEAKRKVYKADFSALGNKNEKQRTEGCSCLYGNPCVDQYVCQDWNNRFMVAKNNLNKK